MTKSDKRAIVEEFEATLGLAELRALSNASLERPLTDKEFNRMMELKRRFLG